MKHMKANQTNAEYNQLRRRLGGDGLDQRRLCAGSGTGGGRTVLSVDAQGQRQDSERGLVTGTIAVAPAGNKELARDPSDRARDATTFPSGSV